MFDIASKYYLYLHDDRDKNIRLFLLLSSLERYVNGAIIEMRRLERARKALYKEVAEILKSPVAHKKKGFRTSYLMSDVHFYFICIDKVYKLLFQLSKELNDADIKKLRTRLNKIFDINIIRNHLEHIDERCLGFLSLSDKKKNKRQPINDFCNFVGSNFSFNGKKFPADKQSLNELKAIYRDLIKILHNKYASKNPAFINRQQMELRSKMITKYVEKIQKEMNKAGLA